MFFIRCFTFVTVLSAAALAIADAAPEPAATSSAPAASPVAPVAIATPPKNPLTGHLPIIDLVPESTFADPGSTQGSPKGTPLSGVVNGTFNLSGTATIPIARGLSASYDRNAGNFLNTTFGRIALNGGYAEPGSLKRRTETERLDYGFPKSGLGFEVGSEFNRFECCAQLEFHDVYVAAKYVTPTIKALHGTKFIFIEKAATSNHRVLPGITAPSDTGKRQYGLSNIVVAIVPLDPRFYLTGLYFNGAFDYFEQAPFPFRFNVFNETANLVLNPTATATLGFTNVTQNLQGAPFPSTPNGAPNPNAIHFVSYYAQLKLHFDLNKIFK